jgi:uncharacterized protein (DUF433 family)
MPDPTEKITCDPLVMEGKPCVRGMRITVALVVNLVANGMTRDEILRNYPDLKADDIQACLRYAAALAEDRVLPFVERTLAVPG